ncbi:mitochondrial outer membrane protein [Cordyceps militaris CM01]|uniref:Mitochondrial outer membrane protein n=1 Tax=Cordyceps militaris (strain CM01) TaxID=983644 RepID=G3JBR2_CORMM|nr:mitochondrial outer membrane protein [Cordyceps militaris CM01]EGX93688.1 mitochondrial outer membrane protein [Cordyceps militaris CM01]
MAAPSSPGLFSAPAPIRSLFKSFPLAVHPAEALPARAATDASLLPRLYVFAHERDAELGLPSYNPSCLKWQSNHKTILRIAQINVRLVPSSNHASPSGALPFLILPTSTTPATVPLTGEKIARFAKQHAPSANLDDPSPRIDAYQALIVHSVRPAWLHSLYVNPANDTLLEALYLPSSALLRPAQRHTLRAAATTEILKATRRTTGGIDATQLFDAAEEAFAALAALLGDAEWFLGAEAPGVLDAELFAYSHLLVGGQLPKRYCAKGSLEKGYMTTFGGANTQIIVKTPKTPNSISI